MYCVFRAWKRHATRLVELFGGIARPPDHPRPESSASAATFVQLVRGHHHLSVASRSVDMYAAAVPDGAIAKIDAMGVQKGLDEKVASYAVGVMKDGRLVLARGYGFADVENNVPATAETVYRLGSIAKQFTSMAIMQLAEGGQALDRRRTDQVPARLSHAGIRSNDSSPAQSHLGIKSYTSLPNFFIFPAGPSRTRKCSHIQGEAV